MPPLSPFLPKGLEKDHYGCTVVVNSVLSSSPFPTPLGHCAVRVPCSWDWKDTRNPGCLPCQQQSLFPMPFPKTVLGISRCGLRDFCSIQDLFQLIIDAAPFLTRCLLYRTAFLESGACREYWLFAFSWESSPCFPWKMKRRGILCIPFTASIRQHRNKGTVWGLEVNLGVCFQCLLSISL